MKNGHSTNEVKLANVCFFFVHSSMCSSAPSTADSSRSSSRNKTKPMNETFEVVKDDQNKAGITKFSELSFYH